MSIRLLQVFFLWFKAPIHCYALMHIGLSTNVWIDHNQDKQKNKINQLPFIYMLPRIQQPKPIQKV